jgi:hypothetical protein
MSPPSEDGGLVVVGSFDENFNKKSPKEVDF